MNKLLKVLEDRKVFLESAYYSSEDTNIPSHIHEIFQKGLPADFRLVGATTRTADEIPPALRSRCVEIYFRHLNPEEIAIIARNAAARGGFKMEDGTEQLVARYAQNGRDAVNIIQIAGGVAQVEGRDMITRKDVEWVIEFGHYSPRIDKKVCAGEFVGCVSGLAVFGNSTGVVIDIEVSAIKAAGGKGTIKVTGIVEEEEMDGRPEVEEVQFRESVGGECLDGAEKVFGCGLQRVRHTSQLSRGDSYRRPLSGDSNRGCGLFRRKEYTCKKRYSDDRRNINTR